LAFPLRIGRDVAARFAHEYRARFGLENRVRPTRLSNDDRMPAGHLIAAFRPFDAAQLNRH